MSLFRYGCSGISLKALLENPELQNAPTLNSGHDLKKPGTTVSVTPNHGSAFLGANLWEKPSDDNDAFDFEYMDLDEFLSENGIPVDIDITEEKPQGSLLAEALKSIPQKHAINPGGQTLQLNIDPPSPPLRTQPSLASRSVKTPKRSISPSLYFPDSPLIQSPDSPLGLSLSPPASPVAKTIEECYLKSLLEAPPDKQVDKLLSDTRKRKSDVIEFEVKAEELSLVTIPGQENFNPKERRFTDEELKPQPMIKKSKKVYVPEDNKDDKYWNRRKKNNVAAKRSRDARRIKENQIAMRAAFLEKANDAMKLEMDALKEENTQLKKRLAKYEGAL